MTTTPASAIACSSAARWIPGSPVAACARVGSGSPSVCETSYLGIRQPGHGNAALVAGGDTCMAQIRGAGGDAFRTGLPRLFKNVDPFRKPEASGKPCGVTQELSSLPVTDTSRSCVSPSRFGRCCHPSVGRRCPWPRRWRRSRNTRCCPARRPCSRPRCPTSGGLTRIEGAWPVAVSA